MEEMLLLCQRSEEYNQFMLAKLGSAGAVSPTAESAGLENTFRSGHFNMAVRELIAYYINMVRKWPPILSVFPSYMSAGTHEVICCQQEYISLRVEKPGCLCTILRSISAYIPDGVIAHHSRQP